MVINKYVGKGYEYLMLIMGACFAVYFNAKNKIYTHNEESLILFGTVAYLLALSGFFQQHQELTRFAPTMEIYLKALLPLLLFPVFYFAGIKKVEVIAYSVAVAAFIACGASIIDFISGHPRGHRLHGSPIIFGDLAMLFGVLSFVFSVKFYKKKSFPVFLLAAIVGIAASLFSGSRGGWIVLAILLPFLLSFLRRAERRKAGLVFMVVCLVLLVVVSSTENTIKLRIYYAWDELIKIASDDTYASGSLGQRLELWKISWQMFLSNPIFGIGVGEFYALKNNLFISGDISAQVDRFKHSHNEYISILSTMGIVGFAFYVFFFAWLWRCFYRAILTNIFELKLLGVAGVSTILCYLGFSLSESFLSTHLGSGVFYFLMTFYIYLMSQIKTKVARNT
jgi:O-antigen ligase